MNTEQVPLKAPEVANPKMGGVEIDQAAIEAFLKEQEGAKKVEQPSASKEELADLSGAARSAREILGEFDTSFVTVQQGQDAERAKALKLEIAQAEQAVGVSIAGEDATAHLARLQQEAGSGADTKLASNKKLLAALESRTGRYADMRQTMMEMGDKLGVLETLNPEARNSFLSKANSIVKMADNFLQSQIVETAKDASFGGQAKSALLLEKQKKIKDLQGRLIAAQQKFSPPN